MLQAVYSFPFGRVTMRHDGERLFSLICTETPADAAEESHAASAFSDRVYEQLQEYLHGARTRFDVPCQLTGTAFQRAVWDELLRIPYGETRTYKDIASALGNSRAARAVGMACHSNPLHIIVPCHRVISVGGSLTGYAGGLGMKAALLKLEKGWPGGG